MQSAETTMSKAKSNGAEQETRGLLGVILKFFWDPKIPSWFRFFRAVVGICAGLAIIFYIFQLSPAAALFGTIGTVFVAIVLVIFAQIAHSKGPNTPLAWSVIVFVGLMFMASVLLLWTWLFFKWPSHIGRFLGEGQAPNVVHVGPPPEPDPKQPPDEFVPRQYVTADDDKFPLFGAPSDDQGMLRQWMRLVDGGALRKLKLQDLAEARLFWLLTEEFKDTYSPFDARVHVLTTDKVISAAFLVRSGSQLLPLPRLPDQGRDDIVLFDVPKSKAGDQLLVFVGMKKNSHDAMIEPRTFLIRTRVTRPN